LAVVPVTLVLVFILGLSGDASSAPKSRVVRNCGGNSTGAIRLIEPAAGRRVADDAVTVEVRGRCRGGLPFSIGIDGVGYDLNSSGTLVPRPDFNPGCASCWPQLRLPRGAKRFSHPLPIDPGVHTMTLKPGIRGSDLPTFRPLRVRFDVVAGEVSSVGNEMDLLVAGAVVLLAAGGTVLANPARGPSSQPRDWATKHAQGS
jgi:hypothetical protein